MHMQVLPDLVKFMDSIHSKMMSVHKMTGQLEIEAGELPSAKEFFVQFRLCSLQPYNPMEDSLMFTPMHAFPANFRI